MLRIGWPPWCNKVITIYLQCSFAVFWSMAASKFLNLRSKSVCWPRKRFVKSNLFIFTPCLPHYSHPIHWYQTKESLCLLLWCRPTQEQGRFTLDPLPFGKQPVCSFSNLNCNLPATSLDTSLWLGLSCMDSTVPNGPLMLWTALQILLLNTDLAGAPLTQALLGILAL